MFIMIDRHCKNRQRIKQFREAQLPSGLRVFFLNLRILGLITLRLGVQAYFITGKSEVLHLHKGPDLRTHC